MHKLLVDLDEALVKSNLLYESLFYILKQRPFSLFKLLFRLFKGSSYLKKCILEEASINPDLLPYNDELLKWLKDERSKERELILVTESADDLAESIADKLEIFSEVIRLDKDSGKAKSERIRSLKNLIEDEKFDYLTNFKKNNDLVDLAENLLITNQPDSRLEEIKKKYKVVKHFKMTDSSISQYMKAIRVHHWIKNILIFVPVVLSDTVNNFKVWTLTLIGFVAFSLIASSIYILNDFLDLEADRLHQSKSTRPFASGDIDIAKGFFIFSLSFSAGLGISLCLGGKFLFWIIVYIVTTISYSVYLKEIVILDVILLSGFYTTRIAAGTAVTGMGLSFWLIIFSVFIFLSLAFVKRYAEISIVAENGREDSINRRGYYISDRSVVQSLGIGSGYVAVLVAALYINSPEILILYKSPKLMWGVVLVLLFWISRVWIFTLRSEICDDPLLFAIKDKASLISGFLLLLILIAGKTGIIW